MIRSEVGRQTGIRHTPSLTFVIDEVQENAQHIEKLLVEARKSDEEVAQKATGAKHAGEADPYKAPREDEDEDDE